MVGPMGDVDRLIRPDPSPHLELALQLAHAGKKYAARNPEVSSQMIEEALSILEFVEENYTDNESDEPGVQFFEVKDRPRFNRLAASLKEAKTDEDCNSDAVEIRPRRRRPGFPEEAEAALAGGARRGFSIFGFIRRSD